MSRMPSANKDGYLTGSELGLFLSDKITSLTNGRQSPRYGKLRELGFDRGDFVFEVGTSAERRPIGGRCGFACTFARAPHRDEPGDGARSRSSQPSTDEELVLTGNQTLVLMDQRLTFSMIGTPFGARRDLVGIFANGTRKGIGDRQLHHCRGGRNRVQHHADADRCWREQGTVSDAMRIARRRGRTDQRQPCLEAIRRYPGRPRRSRCRVAAAASWNRARRFLPSSRHRMEAARILSASS